MSERTAMRLNDHQPPSENEKLHARIGDLEVLVASLHDKFDAFLAANKPPEPSTETSTTAESSGAVQS